MASKVIVRTATSGAQLDGGIDDPLSILGLGAAQPSSIAGTTSFIIQNDALNREVVFRGAGFSFDVDGAPADGMVTSLTVRGIGGTLTLASFTFEAGVAGCTTIIV